MKRALFSCTPVILLTLSACQDLCVEAAEYPPSVQLGTGSGTFQFITEETVLTQSWGPQGGSHIWGAIQTTGLYPGAQTLLGGPQNPLSVHFSISHEEETLASLSDTFVVLTGDSASAEGHGFTVFINGLPSDWSYDYGEEEAQKPRTISAQVDVTDACGTSVSDKVSTLFSF